MMNDKSYLSGLDEALQNFDKIKVENKKLKNDIEIAHGAMVKAIQENHRLKAAIKRKDEAIKDFLELVDMGEQYFGPYERGYLSEICKKLKQALQDEEPEITELSDFVRCDCENGFVRTDIAIPDKPHPKCPRCRNSPFPGWIPQDEEVDDD